MKVGFDQLQQRRRLHGRKEIIKKALLATFGGAFGSRFRLTVQRPAIARDVYGFQRGFEVGMDDL